MFANKSVTSRERSSCLWRLKRVACTLLISSFWLAEAVADPTPNAIPLATLARSSEDALEFSRDGRKLITADPDGAMIWDTTNWKSLTPVIAGAAQGPIRAAAISNDGARLLIAQGSIIVVYDIIAAKRVAALEHHSTVNSAAFGANSDIIIAGSENGMFWVWSLVAPDAPKKKKYANAVRLVLFESLRNRALVLTAGDAKVAPDSGLGLLAAAYLWDLAAAEEINWWGIDHLTRGKKGLGAGDEGRRWRFAAAFSADGELVATILDGQVVIHSAATGIYDMSLIASEPFGWVGSVAFSPNGQMITTGGGIDAKDSVDLWDVRTRKIVRSLDHAEGCRNPRFSLNGSAVSLTAADPKRKDVAGGVWETSTGRRLWRPAPDHKVLLSAWGSDKVFAVTPVGEGKTGIHQIFAEKR
jgi:WD40 repeat protein